MADTTIDFKAMAAALGKDRPIFKLLPIGSWKFQCIGANWKEEEVRGKKDPNETYKFTNVLFELIPEEQVSGDLDEGRNMTTQNLVAERQWHRIDLRKPSDFEALIQFLDSIECYDENIPVYSENGQPDSLSLVADKKPMFIADVQPHIRQDGKEARKIGVPVPC